MKTSLLIILLIVVLIPIPLIYAPPESRPEDDFKFSDHVVTGKIISSEIIPDPREDNSVSKFYDTVIYHVQVLQWHKNPMNEDIITISGIRFPNDVVREPDWGIAEFEIGDIVYLYLDETENGLMFREYGSKLLELTTHSFLFDKQGCELLIFEQWQPTVEGKEWAKKNLDECVKKGFIAQELADMAPNVRGYGTASVTAAYQFANRDIWKTIKILQDPNFPNNISRLIMNHSKQGKQ